MPDQQPVPDEANLCHSQRDGECTWEFCPQLVEYKTGCPLSNWHLDEEGNKVQEDEYADFKKWWLLAWHSRDAEVAELQRQLDSCENALLDKSVEESMAMSAWRDAVTERDAAREQRDALVEAGAEAVQGADDTKWNRKHIENEGIEGQGCYRLWYGLLNTKPEECTCWVRPLQAAIASAKEAQ